MNTRIKRVSNSTSNLLDTFRPECYNECDWNGARIIVIVQQTKSDSSGK